MADIKTKDNAKGTIRTIDKAAVATQRMKQAYIATKEKAERSVNANSSSAEEYASDKLESGIDEVVHDGAYAFDKAGRKGLETTKENIRTAKDGIQRFKQQRAEQSLRKQASQNTSSAIKTVDKAEKTIKQSATSSGKKTIKFAGKEATKTAQKSVKTAEQTAKTAIKTSQQAAKAAQKTAQATVKDSQKAAQAAKAAAKAAVKFAKVAAKAVVAAVKATVAAIKGIVAAIAAGGWIAVVVILLICMIGLVVGSVFGIFAPNPDNENGITVVQTVREANAEYEARIAEIKSRYDYDMCFVTGEPCEWSLAIAVYAVKMNRTEDVVTFDEAKAEVLKEVYRSLNRMDIHTEQITVKEPRLETQEDGSVVSVEQKVVKTYLYIETVPLTAEEAANLYGFDTKQREQLGELLSDKNKEMWDALLPGQS